EMLTQHTPFEGETPSHMIVSILESEAPPLARYAKVPAELERIVTKALRKDRKERYQTALDLALDLKRLKQELEVAALLKRTVPDAGGGEIEAAGASQAVVEAEHEPAGHTADLAPARPTSSAEYLVA